MVLARVRQPGPCAGCLPVRRHDMSCFRPLAWCESSRTVRGWRSVGQKSVERGPGRVRGRDGKGPLVVRRFAGGAAPIGSALRSVKAWFVGPLAAPTRPATCTPTTRRHGHVGGQDGGWSANRRLRRRTGTVAEASVAWQGRMRWYNPGLWGFEWREAPRGNGEALAPSEGCRSGELCAEVYAQWRGLGASDVASSRAARSTASSVAPLALKAATTEPSGRRRSNRSGSRWRRYPGGRFGSNLPPPVVGLS